MTKNKKQNNQPQLSPENYIRTKGRSLPIHECLINSDWQDKPLLQIVVCRVHKSGNYTFGAFLVDKNCLGVKECFYEFNLTEDEYIDFKENTGATDLDNVSYDLVHNIIYGAIDFAERFGISPSPDFSTVKYLLEEDTDAISPIEIEFGEDGEPSLIVFSQDELNKYLPVLQRKVSDIEYHVIEQDFDKLLLDLDDEEAENLQLLKNMIENSKHMLEEINKLEARFQDLENMQGMTEAVYQYQNPEYPQSVHLENLILQELYNTEYNDVFDPVVIRNILLCDRASLIRDLENITLHEIGRTYPLIEDEDWDEEYVATLTHTVLFLAELGSSQSLNVILQILRQDLEFLDYHFADSVEEIIAPAIFKLGVNQLPDLLNFMKEPGLEAVNKSSVLKAVAAVGIIYPERRQEVIHWYRDLMNFYIDHIENNLHYDASLGALVMFEMINLKAIELLDEIERMFATNQVDTELSGDFSEVSEEILNFEDPYTFLENLNIYDWYKSIELS